MVRTFKIYRFQLCDTVLLTLVTKLSIISAELIYNWKCVPFGHLQHFLYLSLPYPGSHQSAVCFDEFGVVFVCLFVCLESTCEWDHKVFVFNLFHKSKMPQGSPCCCIWQDFLFYGWIIFHCVIHNLYQSIIIVLWFTHGWLNDLLKSGLLMKIIFIIWNIIYYETYKNVKN